MTNGIDIAGLTCIVLLVLLCSVVYTDIKTHRINNTMVIAIIFLGLVSGLLEDGSAGIVTWIGGMAVGFGMFLPFYMGGGMGAGDVKLLAAVGSVIGPIPALIAGGVALMAGLPLGLIALASRFIHDNGDEDVALETHGPKTKRVGLRKITIDDHVKPGKERVPYAAAIATGAIAGLWYSGHIQELIGAITI